MKTAKEAVVYFASSALFVGAVVAFIGTVRFLTEAQWMNATASATLCVVTYTAAMKLSDA